MYIMNNQSNQVPIITVGQYDNGNKLVFNLTKDNLVESISGATIKLKFKEKNKGYEMKRQCKINDSEMAEVEYVLTSEDTNCMSSVDLIPFLMSTTTGYTLSPTALV